MLDEGFWAEIKIGGEHLRLFSERNAMGVQTPVYNVNTKSWIAPSEPVDDIEQGKERAGGLRRGTLKADRQPGTAPCWSGGDTARRRPPPLEAIFW
jgi:hypothetical protein